jgi:hypothetical protein
MVAAARRKRVNMREKRTRSKASKWSRVVAG